MISGRSAPVTAIAKVFNLLGLVYVTLPVRIAIAGFLALRRRWWHLAAFAAAIVLSEVLIGTLKGIYDRARPPGSLVATSGASFPSGHSVAATVTVVAAVIALVPPGAAGAVGRGRGGLLGPDGAVPRLPGAHWLSDAIAGVLLGPRAPCWPPWWSASSRALDGAWSRPFGPSAHAGCPPGPAVSSHPVAVPVLPSSRYRHPGDVIRLIAGGLLADRGAGGRWRWLPASWSAPTRRP